MLNISNVWCLINMYEIYFYIDNKEINVWGLFV